MGRRGRTWLFVPLLVADFPISADEFVELVHKSRRRVCRSLYALSSCVEVVRSLLPLSINRVEIERYLLPRYVRHTCVVVIAAAMLIVKS